MVFVCLPQRRSSTTGKEGMVIELCCAVLCCEQVCEKDGMELERGTLVAGKPAASGAAVNRNKRAQHDGILGSEKDTAREIGPGGVE